MGSFFTLLNAILWYCIIASNMLYLYHFTRKKRFLLNFFKLLLESILVSSHSRLLLEGSKIWIFSIRWVRVHDRFELFNKFLHGYWGKIL